MEDNFIWWSIQYNENGVEKEQLFDSEEALLIQIPYVWDNIDRNAAAVSGSTPR